MMEQANIYRATRSGQPVRVREECEETQPEHADMLRYDLAFCNPADPSLVVLPIFTCKYGNTQGTVTIARWRSFGITLTLVGKRHEEQFDSLLPSLDQWQTYTHPKDKSGRPDYTSLAPQTMADYMATEKMKLKRWR